MLLTIDSRHLLVPGSKLRWINGKRIWFGSTEIVIEVLKAPSTITFESKVITGYLTGIWSGSENSIRFGLPASRNCARNWEFLDVLPELSWMRIWDDRT